MADKSLPLDAKLSMLRVGAALDFGVLSPGQETSKAEDEERTVSAKWIEELLDQNTRTVRTPVLISGAIIKGPLNLGYAIFEREVSLVDCTFTDVVDLSFASFRRAATFRRSRFFRTSDWHAAHADLDLDISDGLFAEGATFREVHVERILDGSGVHFKKVANFQNCRVGRAKFLGAEFEGELDFYCAEIKGDIFCNLRDGKKRVSFGGNIDVRSARIGGNLEFLGAEFNGSADFEGITVDGDVVFRSPSKELRTTFGKKVDFISARFGGDANFDGAIFMADANFTSLSVEGDGLFRTDDHGNRLSFEGEANFSNARFGGDVEFLGSHFAATATFSYLQTGGYLSFSDEEGNKSVFKADASFRNARIGGNANFQGAGFESKANFAGIRTAGHAFFCTDSLGNRTLFRNGADFLDAEFAHIIDFSGAQFDGPASFNRVHVGASAFFKSDSHKNRTTFHEKSNFINAQIRSNAVFSGAIFENEVRFDNVQIGSDAYFNRDLYGNPVSFREQPKFLASVFGSDALFESACFGAGASFNNSVFRGEADFRMVDFGCAETTFVHTRFEVGGNFRSARFGGVTDYTGVLAKGDTHFSSAVFKGPAVFKEASFQSMFFGKLVQGRQRRTRCDGDGARFRLTLPLSWRWAVRTSNLTDLTTFPEYLDFRGLTYERIYVDDLQKLSARFQPFDRQPYSQLEAVFGRVATKNGRTKSTLKEERSSARTSFTHRPSLSGYWIGFTSFWRTMAYVRFA